MTKPRLPSFDTSSLPATKTKPEPQGRGVVALGPLAGLAPLHETTTEQPPLPTATSAEDFTRAP